MIERTAVVALLVVTLAVLLLPSLDPFGHGSARSATVSAAPSSSVTASAAASPGSTGASTPAGSVGVGSTTAASSGSWAAATPAGSAASGSESARLLSQVSNASGAPLTGRDPADQRQMTLAQAAGTQPGPWGKVTSGSAAPAPRAPIPATSVLGNPRVTGVLANGCAVGYGRVDQCVPAHAPGNKPENCAYLITIFPDGVPVTGRDTLGLDTNKDGTACGDGDNGVPPMIM